MKKVELKRKALFIYGILILLWCLIAISAFIVQPSWSDRLLWAAGVLLGLPCGIFCLIRARRGSDDEVKKALDDLNAG